MNDMMLDFIQLNYESKSFYHIHAAGERDYGRMKDALKERGVPVGLEQGIDLRPYIYDMPAVMDAADLVLCRAGASTISEITAIGRPAILVPSPNVTNNHQEKNAAVLRDAGGAKLIHDADCTGEGLYKETAFLINDPTALKKMADSSMKMGIPDATDRIVSEILSMARKD
jgi:UDP-N-acetylglucosamine--N-acetylmuramyl-(pentapeptide) pyrophosphoryl-undecaprenol N-acetylglucosamine transferase